MTVFTFEPDYPISEASSPRLQEYRADDNYEESISYGLNTDGKKWDLTFDNRTNAERELIISFFETNIGKAFDWLSPRAKTAKYKASDWSWTMTSFNNNTIKVRFTQSFDRKQLTTAMATRHNSDTLFCLQRFRVM